MSDNPALRDGRDRAWVSTTESYEVEFAARDWLMQNSVALTPQHVRFVVDMIYRFPAHLRSQGRIPRQALYNFLSQEIVITR